MNAPRYPVQYEGAAALGCRAGHLGAAVVHESAPTPKSSPTAAATLTSRRCLRAVRVTAEAPDVIMNCAAEQLRRRGRGRSRRPALNRTDALGVEGAGREPLEECRRDVHPTVGSDFVFDGRANEPVPGVRPAESAERVRVVETARRLVCDRWGKALCIPGREPVRARAGGPSRECLDHSPAHSIE